jgi:hypothetical protein
MTTNRATNPSDSSTQVTADGDKPQADQFLHHQQERQDSLRRLARSRILGFAAAAIGVGTFFVSDNVAELLRFVNFPIYPEIFSAILQVIGLILLVAAVIFLTQSWYRYERVRTLSLEAEQENQT